MSKMSAILDHESSKGPKPKHEGKGETKPSGKESAGEPGEKKAVKKEEREHPQDEMGARHAKEMKEVHGRHEDERRDLHGTHREQHRAMHKRHEEEMASMHARHVAEMEKGEPDEDGVSEPEEEAKE